MNLLHRWYCGSSRWAAVVEGSLLPWVLDGAELGPRLLEVGPGPGLTTDVLRHRAVSLTALELDQALAAKLGRRLGGTGVRVVRGDGAALPFRGGSFDAAAGQRRRRHELTGATGPRSNGLVASYGDLEVS